MTIDVLKQFEAVPSVYPDVPAGLSDEAAALDASNLWARIEAYTAHRFTSREVVWTLIADAGDEFHPRLTPMTSFSADTWQDENWQALNLIEGPTGICIPFDGTYRITAQIGGGDVSAPFSEAFRRLAEYSAEIGQRGLLKDAPGATSYSSGIGGEIQESFDRQATWAARAMQNSGAADLLRPYRRA